MPRPVLRIASTCRVSEVKLMPAEVKIIALQSPQLIINELAGEFERRSGYRVKQLLGHMDMPVHARKLIDAREAFDAAFLVPAFLDELANEGKIVDDTRTPFLRVPIGVAVRAGAPRPDISSVEAFKRALLAARSVAYLRAGMSGPHLQALFERWGIAAELQARALRPDTDTVGELVAQGEAEIGVTAIATLMATCGVDVIGPIPSEIQSYVVFGGAVGAQAVVPDVARELIAFVTGPAALPVIRAKGMEPG
jgi:molybdate transport system substrate-binding protein